MLSSNSAHIQVLDSHVVDQIAAGEVVERPASVVKELVENALDAGARNIRIRIQNGGLDFISISDDGRGMGREDLSLCVERFATSKLSTADDLEQLYTYGFRGEALPSIASVSHFSIKTRSLGEESGYILEFDAQGKKQITSISSDYGTVIEVKDLFYNVPARKKFLKSALSESNAIKNVVADFSLAKPEVSFLLQENSKELLSFGELDLLPDRLRKIGLVSGSYVTVHKERTYSSPTVTGEDRNAEIRVHGIISEPIHCPKISSKMKFFVNERSIKSNFLMRAVRDGYESLLKYGFYPSGVLFVDISAHDLDVNVHPQKTEVRFSSEGLVFATVKSAVQEALMKSASLKNTFSFDAREKKVYTLHPVERESQKEITFLGNGGFYSYTPNQPTINEENRNRYAPSSVGGDSVNPVHSDRGEIFFSHREEDLRISPDIQTQELSRIESFRYLGQVFKLYLLFSSDKKIAVLDMHAAHERVTFYFLKKQFLEKEISIQDFLFPLSLPLTILDNSAQLEERLCALKVLGIDAETRNNEILVRGLSPLLDTTKAKEIISEILNKPEGELIEAEIAKKLDAYLARLACHASIRRGQDLKAEEAYQLLEQVQKVELSGWCPHGRPIIWWISEADLEKNFGRA